MQHLVMIYGTGGMGTLTIGRILLEAGLQKFAHGTWFPSYDGRQRGGPSECTVVLSDDQIWSPVRYEVPALLMMHASQLGSFRERVKRGGLAIVERGCSLGRSDIQELEIPAEEVAGSLGGSVAANQVFLGAYVQVSGCFPPEAVDATLVERYEHREDVLKLNRNAFWEGVRLGKSMSWTMS